MSRTDRIRSRTRGVSRFPRALRRPVAIACLLALTGQQAGHAAVCEASTDSAFDICVMEASPGDIVRLTDSLGLAASFGFTELQFKPLTVDIGDHTLRPSPDIWTATMASYVLGPSGWVRPMSDFAMGDLQGSGQILPDFPATLGIAQGQFAGSIQGFGLLGRFDMPLFQGPLVLSGTNSYDRTWIGNGTLQIGNGGTTGTLGTGEVTNDGTLVFNRSDATTVANNISGPGLVRQDGSGTLVLTGANTYAGGTIVNAGTLAVDGGGNLGTGPLTLAGGQLTVRGSTTLAPPVFTVSGSGTLAATTGTTLNFSAGSVSLAGAAFRIGTTGDAGTVILGRDFFEASGLGSLRIGGGTVHYEIHDSRMLSISGGLTVDAGAILNFSPADTAETDYLLEVGELVGAGTVRLLDNAHKLVVQGGHFAGSIEGAGGLVVLRGSNLVLSGDNSYGGLTLVQGTLQVGAGDITGTLGLADVYLNDGSGLVFNRSGTSLADNYIYGAGEVHQAGPGTLVLTADNAYFGTTRIASGSTLQAGNGGATGRLGWGVVRNDGTLVFNRSDASLVANVIEGTGGLRQRGAETLILTGNNTYAGGTWVDTGTLQVGDGGLAGSLGTGRVEIASGALLDIRRAGELSIGAVSGDGSLRHAGPGTTRITAPSLLRGATYLVDGTLEVTGAYPSGDLVFEGGGLRTLTDMYLAPSGLAVAAGPGRVEAATGTTLVLNPAGVMSNFAYRLRFGSPVHAGTIELHSPMGPVEIGGGTLRAGADLHLYGLQIDAAGSLDVAGRTVLVPDFNGSGKVLLSGPTGTLVAGYGEFSGSIAGPGGLVKHNDFSGEPGTLTLTGANSYTGTTTIADGTLQVGNGGTAGSLGTGAVLNDASLVFNRSDDLTVANAISGTGSVRKLGAGRMVFSGTGTYTGPTSVEAGVLSVNGSLASAVNVLSGATLGGSGRVGSVNVAAGGILGAGNSIGVLTTGDLVLAPGSTLQVEANAAGAADRVDAANVTVEGANVQVLAEPGRYARNTRYTILTHSGSRTGSFAGVSSNLAFLTPTLAYEPGAVLLELNAADAPVYSSVAATPNQAAVANYLQSFADTAATEQAAGLIAMVDGMDATQARRAFETLAGSAHASASQVAQAIGRNFSQMIRARGAEDTGVERVTTSAGFTATVQGAKGLADFESTNGSRKGLGLAQGSVPASGRGLWAQAIGGGGRNEGDGNGGDLRYGASGLVAGFDHELDSRWMLGAALGRTRSHWTSNGATGALGSGAITSYQAGLYARHSAGPWNAMLEGTYGLHRFTTHRTVDLGAGAQTASSGHRAREWALGAQLEYAPAALQPGQWQMRPVAGLRHARFDEEGLAESGAGAANLTVAQRKLGSTTLQAGAKWLHAFEDGKGQVQLQAMVSHLAGDNDAPLSARMAGQATSFTAGGTPLPRDALALSAAITRQLSSTLSFYANAAAEYRGSGHSAYSLVAGIRKRW